MAEISRHKSGGRRDRKNKDTGKSPTSGETTINIYHTEQHGSHNTVIMNSPSSRGDKEEDPFDRKETLIDLVNSILNPTNASKPSTMSVQDFKEKFRKEYKEEFDKVTGVSVLQFVDKNSQFFETVQDKKLRMMIKQRRRKNPKKKKKTKREDPHLEPISLTEDISEAEYMTAESGQCSEESSEESSPNEAYLESCKERLGKMLSDTSDSDDNAKTVKESDPMFSEWKQVCRIKSQVPPPSSENHSGLQRQFHGTMSEEEKRDLTSRLLQRKDSHDFILKQSVKEYLNHPCKLVLDLVSLWNTAARTTSYIVIRLDQNMNMSLISDFLKLDNFTSLPQYQYFEVEITKSLYGVFEIPSSHGAGQPVITRPK